MPETLVFLAPLRKKDRDAFHKEEGGGGREGDVGVGGGRFEGIPGTPWLLGFCTLCFFLPTKMLHLNAPFFPVKCTVSPKKSLKCSDNAHYTNGFLN